MAEGEKLATNVLSQDFALVKLSYQKFTTSLAKADFSANC